VWNTDSQMRKQFRGGIRTKKYSGKWFSLKFLASNSSGGEGGPCERRYLFCLWEKHKALLYIRKRKGGDCKREGGVREANSGKFWRRKTSQGLA